MTTLKSIPIKGLVLRATRADSCGTPLCGPTASVVSKGFITINLTPEVDTGQDFSQKLADGTFCVEEKDRDRIKWWNVDAELCGVDPALLELAGGLDPSLDYASQQVGFYAGDVSDSAFNLETWSKLSQQACDASGAQSFGYWLLPGLTNMRLQDFVIGNNLIDMKLVGNTFKNPNWGKGPYDVVPSAAVGHAAGPLLECFPDDKDWLYLATPVEPPTPATGYTAVDCGDSDPGDPAVTVPCV